MSVRLRPITYMLGLVFAATLAIAPAARGDVPVITTLADFEDDSVAATITDLQNILPTECEVHRNNIPARGQFSLVVEVGATQRGASVACNLRLREPRRFVKADRVSAFFWLKEGSFDFAFRVRDARGQIFESAVQRADAHNAWTTISAPLDASKLKRIRGDAALTWPLQIDGFRIVTQQLGKQYFYLDDLQVEHEVDRRDMIHGEFAFNKPTRIYSPGAPVGAQIMLENCSRQDALRLTVELEWTRPDGTPLSTDKAIVTLPASGRDFRSRQAVDFSQRVDQSGLYLLVARVRADGWFAPNTFQTSVAVTPSNRLLTRGRWTFFGVQSDLLRESTADQQLEVAIAKETGVQLLVVETSWRTIEPGQNQFNLEALDAVVDALVRRDVDIAPLIALRDPPEWAGNGDGRVRAVTATLEHLARHFGPRVNYYQLSAEILPADDPAAAATVLQKIAEPLKRARNEARLLSPAIDIASGAGQKLQIPDLPDGLSWCFRTTGPTDAVEEQLSRFSETNGREWRASDWWLHYSEPLIGPTHNVDAEAVLRHCVFAAKAGVSGLIWHDLRDNDNDPSQPEEMRGLVRRDFSPKASLLGYASTVGMLSGLGCNGPVQGAPAEFESAMFIGSDRHVAVLLPKPNRIYPAVLGVRQSSAGELTLRDFERRPMALLQAGPDALVRSLPRPQFITLNLENTRPEPQLAFVPAALRFPSVAFAGGSAIFDVRIDAATEITRGYLRAKATDHAPFEVSPTRRTFKADAGETVEIPLALAARPDEPFDRSELELRIGLNRDAVDVPIEVRPLASIGAVTNPQQTLRDDQHLLAELTPAPGQRASADVHLYAGYDAKTLYLRVAVANDSLVPAKLGPMGLVSGDDLVVGVAVEGADDHVEVRVNLRDGVCTPLFGAADSESNGWRCDVAKLDGGTGQVYLLSIPAKSVYADKFAAGQRLRLAARYVDDDADGFPPVPMCWGIGLDGRRSADEFRWVVLD